MKKVRLSVMVFLIAPILMGCIPSRARGFSIHLLADEVPATELSIVDLTDLELQEEPILSGDDIIAYARERHEIELTAEAYERAREHIVARPILLEGLAGSQGPIEAYVLLGLAASAASQPSPPTRSKSS